MNLGSIYPHWINPLEIISEEVAKINNLAIYSLSSFGANRDCPVAFSISEVWGDELGEKKSHNACTMVYKSLWQLSCNYTDRRNMPPSHQCYYDFPSRSFSIYNYIKKLPSLFVLQVKQVQKLPTGIYYSPVVFRHRIVCNKI